MRAFAGRPPVVLRSAGCLALFSVLAVPVFGLAGVFPAGTGVAFVLGALLIGPLRRNQGTAVALLVTAVTMATLAVSSLAGRAMATIVLLVALTSLAAGLAAHRGWHTALVAAPTMMLIFFDASTSTPFRIASQRIAFTVAAAGAVAAFCVAVPGLLRRLPPDVRANLGDHPERVPDPDTPSGS